MPDTKLNRPRLNVEPLEVRDVPAMALWSTETFNASTQIPADWSTYGAVRVEANRGPSGTGNLLFSTGVARAWESAELPADQGIRATFRGDSLTPTRLFLRGRDLGTAKPTVYVLQVSRGGRLDLYKVVNGVETAIGSVRSRFATLPTWFEVTFTATGSLLEASIKRLDNGQSFTKTGYFLPGEQPKLQFTDGTISSPGRVGVGKKVGAFARIDDVQTLLPAVNATANFDGLPAGTLPSGWAATANTFGSTGDQLRSSTRAAVPTFAGPAADLPSDVTVRTQVMLDSLVPAKIVIRGRGLETTSPTYYTATLTRGLDLKIAKVVNGVETVLSTLKTKTYSSGFNAEVTFSALGDRLQVRVKRLDTNLWLTDAGEWKPEAVSALVARDVSIASAGRVALGRGAATAGTLIFDQFEVTPIVTDVIAPKVTATFTPYRAGTATGIVTFSAKVVDAIRIARVEYSIDGDLIARINGLPATKRFDTRNLPNGSHTLRVKAWDADGNVGESRLTFRTQNVLPAKPEVARNYDHIRYAALAYNGNPMGLTEQQILRDSVDLVVPNVRYLSTIQNASPETPQMIYSNVSNLYLDLLTDWLNFADAKKANREEAFYHVARPTDFTGDSPSTRPVTWFWNVQRGPATGTAGGSANVTSLFSQANNATANDVAFGGVGQAMSLAMPDRFREIHLTLAKPAGSSFAGTWEYVASVDATGKPTVWKTLNLLGDTSNAMKQSGQVTFDPPADWKTSVWTGAPSASAGRLFYVRYRTTAGATADLPVASKILGRDFVNANGTTSGVIPAFDAAADANSDGYLNDAEYARRKPGSDARFVHESRLFYPYYGQMRFVTNPSGEAVANWAGDYHRRFLSAYPLADGLFMDNSGGRLPTDNASLLEVTETYASDYGNVLAAINRAVSPKWVLANTAGGGSEADRVAKQVPATIEEFALRPMSSQWSQFRDLATNVTRRLSLTNPPGTLILDSLSTGGSPTDDRTRMAALSYYYLLADPEATYFMVWGGEEPASAWSRHWFDAIKTDVGQPRGTWSTFATGTDPSKPALKYEVFSREYDNALVLYKPLSYTPGSGTGTTADATATTHSLNGNYRRLNADGTLGGVISAISLRNGEGAVLMKVA
jgi:Bacterial Ig domain